MLWTVLFFVIGIAILFYALNILGLLNFTLPSLHGAKLVNGRLSNQFYYKKEGISFCPSGDFLTKGERMITGADSKTFVVQGYHYARDKSDVYYQDRVISNVDVGSFRVLPSKEMVDDKYINSPYARDKSQVFYHNRIVKHAEVDHFRHLWGNYSRDDGALFYCGELFLQTESVAERLANDTVREYLQVDGKVFYHTKPIEGVDIETFLLLGRGLARDQNRVYIHDTPIKSVHAPSFRCLNQHYARDDNHVYYYDDTSFKFLPKCDPLNLHILYPKFCKDNEHVYYCAHILKGAKPNSFGKNKAALLDKNSDRILVYYDDEYAEFIDRENITDLDGQYYLYNNEIYIGNKRVNGASLDGFSVYPESELYASDNQNVFFQASKIKEADRGSFRVINSSFAKDNNHVYFRSYKLIDTDPDNFIYTEGMLGQAIDDSNARLLEA